MQSLPRLVRQSFGCAYEAPAPSTIAVHPPTGCGYTGERPTVCPGYTTSLPEVQEIAIAHLHWTKGELQNYCRGYSPDAITRGVTMIAGAWADVDNWRMTPVSQGGGREGS